MNLEATACGRATLRGYAVPASRERLRNLGSVEGTFSGSESASLSLSGFDAIRHRTTRDGDSSCSDGEADRDPFFDADPGGWGYCPAERGRLKPCLPGVVLAPACAGSGIVSRWGWCCLGLTEARPPIRKGAWAQAGGCMIPVPAQDGSNDG